MDHSSPHIPATSTDTTTDCPGDSAMETCHSPTSEALDHPETRSTKTSSHENDSEISANVVSHMETEPNNQQGQEDSQTTMDVKLPQKSSQDCDSYSENTESPTEPLTQIKSPDEVKIPQESDQKASSTTTTVQTNVKMFQSVPEDPDAVHEEPLSKEETSLQTSPKDLPAEVSINMPCEEPPPDQAAANSSLQASPPQDHANISVSQDLPIKPEEASLLEAAEQEIKVCKSQIEELQQKLKTVEEQNKKKIEKLVEDLMEAQRAHKTATSNHDAIIRAIKQEKELLKEDVEILQRNLAQEEQDRNDELVKYNQMINGLKRQYNDVREENDNLKQDMMALETDLLKKIKEHNALVDSYRQLLADRDMYKASCQEKEIKLLQLAKDKRNMESDLSKMKEMIEKASEEHEEQVAELRQQVKEAVEDKQKALHDMLLAAVREGSRCLVEVALKHEGNPDTVASDDHGYHLLHLAAIRGDAGIVKCLLNAKADPQAKDCYGDQAIHTASREGQGEVVKVLVSHVSGLLHAKDSRGRTAVQLAAASGHIGVLEALYQIDHKILSTPEPDSDKQLFPLHFSASNNQLRASEWLLKQTFSVWDIVSVWRGITSLGGPLSSGGAHILLAAVFMVIRWCRVGQLALFMICRTPAKYLGSCMYSLLSRRQLNSELDLDSLKLEDNLQREKPHTVKSEQEQPQQEKENPLLQVKSFIMKVLGRNRKTVLLPEDKKPSRADIQPKGLPNLGNTCYMNSVLQCLYHTLPLTQHFSRLNKKQAGEVANCYKEVCASLTTGQRVHEAVAKMKKIAGKYDELFRGYEQREAHDLLAMLLVWLHDDLTLQTSKSKTEVTESIISTLFYGHHNSRITCPATGSSICNTKEPFSNITLAVNTPHSVKLERLLQQYYREQTVDWECLNCSTEHSCTQKTTILELPSVLIIHLSRYNKKDPSGSKTKLIFPARNLSLDDYIVAKEKREAVRYELTAVCTHHGTMTSGHYLAYCKNWRTSKWYCLNDDHISMVSEQNVLAQTNAHILFYRNPQSTICDLLTAD